MKTLFIGIITLLLVEASLCGYTFITQGRLTSAADLKEMYFKNLYGGLSTEDCSWGTNVRPHPYLSYYYAFNAPCRPKKNNYGFAGSDFPLEYDSQYFSILLIGGSVAEQLGGHVFGGESIYALEKTLNDKFYSPNKKPFKVLNASMAGNKQPTSAIAALFFIDKADVVISVEGYNESINYKAGRVFESPSMAWLDLASAQANPAAFLALKVVMSAVRKTDFFPLNQSYALHYLSRGIISKLSEKMNENRSQIDPYGAINSGSSLENNQKKFLESYVKYLDEIYALSKFQNKKFILFLQPNPFIFKDLTAEEKINVSHLESIEDSIKIVYPYILKNTKATTVSLATVFQDHPETLYLDHIHTNPKGLEIMANSIAKTLAEKEHWPAKK